MDWRSWGHSSPNRRWRGLNWGHGVRQAEVVWCSEQNLIWEVAGLKVQLWKRSLFVYIPFSFWNLSFWNLLYLLWFSSCFFVQSSHYMLVPFHMLSLGALIYLKDICPWLHHPDDIHKDVTSLNLSAQLQTYIFPQVGNLEMLTHFSCRVNLVLGTTIQRKFVLFWKSSTVNLDGLPSSRCPTWGPLKAWFDPHPSWHLPLDLCSQLNH